MLNVHLVEVTSFQQNCRILWEEGSKDAVVVDPGGDAAKVKAELESLRLNLKEIWLTHSHIDHCGGVAPLKRDTGALLVGHRLESEWRARVTEVAAMYGFNPDDFENCPEPDRYVDEGDDLVIGDERFEILFTPGHSEGHLCFYHRAQEILIAGDTIFSMSIGRTDLPGGDHETLLSSIKEKLLVLPPQTRVLPGHGPETTIQKEASMNPFLTGSY